MYTNEDRNRNVNDDKRIPAINSIRLLSIIVSRPVHFTSRNKTYKILSIHRKLSKNDNASNGNDSKTGGWKTSEH